MPIAIGHHIAQHRRLVRLHLDKGNAAPSALPHPRARAPAITERSPCGRGAPGAATVLQIVRTLAAGAGAGNSTPTARPAVELNDHHWANRSSQMRVTALRQPLSGDFPGTAPRAAPGGLTEVLRGPIGAHDRRGPRHRSSWRTLLRSAPRGAVAKVAAAGANVYDPICATERFAGLTAVAAALPTGAAAPAPASVAPARSQFR